MDYNTLEEVAVIGEADRLAKPRAIIGYGLNYYLYI